MVAYGIKLVDEALDAAQAGQDKIEDIGDAASARVRSARREAEYAVGSAADKTRAAGQRTRRRATRAVRDLADRVAR
jgi:F0F1-type ATP synthase membrane subunit b/b'